MFDVDKILETIEKEQKILSFKNRSKIKDYFLKNEILLEKYDLIKSNYLYEKEILFMIKHFTSIGFIKKYFKLNNSKCIIDIAKKYKCQSYILSSFTENIKARCFSKNQIIRACEEFNYICPMCFKPLDIVNISTITGHHILPFARGGETRKENCLPLHVRCHFEDFKILHSLLFDSNDPVYSAKYFNLLKEKLSKRQSGMDYLLELYIKNHQQ